jgi:hypothetical protein
LTPSFDTLSSAGPVIIINHCTLRHLKFFFPTLLLLHSFLLPNISMTAGDRLVSARRKGLDSVMYQRALRSVLESRYELVGRPIIQRLWVLKARAISGLVVSEIGLLLTSPTCDGSYLIKSHPRPDLYIPSYIPSLSALIISYSRLTGAGPTFIASCGTARFVSSSVWEEIQVVQSLNTRVTSLFLGTATSSSHPLQSSRASEVISLPVSRVTECWRQRVRGVVRTSRELAPYTA